jgi:hypothetical protein
MSDPTPRNNKGHWLEKPQSAMAHAFNSETAAAASRKRWKKYREAAADAIVEKMGTAVPGVTTPEAAWGVLNARLAVQIMKSDKPRGDDLAVLGRNMGAIPNAYERSEMENRAVDGPGLPGSAIAELIGILRDVIGPRDVINGTATNVTDTRNE